ncbi:MAG: four helix bundle protein [Chthoniobacteraceae bacterium]
MQSENCKVQNGERRRLADSDALEERLLDFAARIGKAVDALPDSRLGRHVAGQLVRCGTSPAPNYGEACAAESRADFILKLGIVLKELRETRIWLRLSVKSNLLALKKLDLLIDEANQLMNIIGKSIVTAKANTPRRTR